MVADSTTVRVIQRGSAVGLSDYPIVPDPIWPEAEHEDKRSVNFGNPKKTGGVIGSVYTEWPVEWTYEFEDTAPLIGVPNVVTGI